MATPYVGEIRMTGFNFAPDGWELCNGQLLPIDLYQTLFNLIGIAYGGDGQTTFALPNLQGRIPFHIGDNGPGDVFVIGQDGGAEKVTLITSELPVHTHLLAASTATGTRPGPSGAVWAASQLGQYSSAMPTHAMAANALQPEGGGMAHDNMPPFLVINFIISLYGIYPSQG